MRVALPLALFTLGLGGFLLLGAAVLALFSAIPGVGHRGLAPRWRSRWRWPRSAGVTSSVLAIDEDEVFFRRARRRPGAAAGPASRSPPGVLFLQIDGLGHDVARRAVRDGSMPTLAAWLRAGSHVLASWHTDWSSQTGAAVLGILHGSNHDVPGFRWYDKDRDRVVRVSAPVDAAELERRHSDGRGLLAGDGAGRGNLFTGDAAHVSLTMSSLAHRRARGSRVRRRRERVGAGYYAYFANPVNALRTLGVSLVDVYRELGRRRAQRRADVRPRVAAAASTRSPGPGRRSSPATSSPRRCWRTCSPAAPVVYADFLGYDEVAHHSGVERFDTLEVLRSIDQQIGRLARAAALAPRDYHLVCLSDHGQTQGEAFADRFGESIEELVGRLVRRRAGTASRRRARAAAGRPRAGRWPRPRRRRPEAAG